MESNAGSSFDVNIKRRKHLVAIDEEIMVKLTEIAKSKKVSSQKLINSWLKEKVIGQANPIFNIAIALQLI